MTPFRFGPPQRQLHGIHHPAVPGRGKRTGVLICNPFGQESVRTHRMFRVLADRLAREGVHVLRFDYHGTGDSSGDDTDGHLDAWRDDVLLAHAELQRRSMGADITWLGARLGATLAALAATHAPGLAEHLVLWEPIADGPRYLAEIAVHHRRALLRSYGLVPQMYKAVPSHEAMGFEMSDTLLAQLRQLSPRQFDGLRAPRITLVAPPRDADTDALAAACTRHGAALARHPFRHEFDWSSEEALNTALVPQDAVRLLTDCVAPAP